MFAQHLKGHLDLLLLAVLADGPAHGYAVIAGLRERSDGGFDLPEGTVYPALHRLEEAGLVGSQWSTESGRRRRVYAVTAPGRRALAEQREGWDRFRDAVQSVLGVPAGRRRRPGSAGGFAAGAAR
jgi:PadR family transcriptional regulator, regulatory protein PadR